tara:strand:+ start:106 stop:453 length:348 start_codon:yes stop_codon:yes gene_type:complete
MPIYSDKAVSSTGGGGGPSYVVNYSSSVAGVQIGDFVEVDKKEPGDEETVVSEYLYVITGITDSDTLTIKYLRDSNGDGNDDPADLSDGSGDSSSTGIASHTFEKGGTAFSMFVG